MKNKEIFPTTALVFKASEEAVNQILNIIKENGFLIYLKQKSGNLYITTSTPDEEEYSQRLWEGLENASPKELKEVRLWIQQQK